MGYTCIRPMKVQNASGEVEMRKPGDAVPEADTWANPGLWIKRGFIQADDIETSRKAGYSREKLLPAREATPEDNQQAVSKVPQQGTPLPGVDTDDASDEQLSELLELSRSDLDALAEEHGIGEPAKMPNKKVVAEAIIQKQSEATE